MGFCVAKDKLHEDRELEVEWNNRIWFIIFL